MANPGAKAPFSASGLYLNVSYHIDIYLMSIFCRIFVLLHLFILSSLMITFGTHKQSHVLLPVCLLPDLQISTGWGLAMISLGLLECLF